MKKILLLTVLLPLALPAYLGAEADPIVPVRADGPLVRINPSKPGTVSPGFQLVLTASGNAEVVRWHLVGGGSDGFYKDTGGRAVVVTPAAPGKLVVVATGASNGKDGAPPEVSIEEYVINVEGATPPAPGPGPGPPPGPGPAPPPVIPPDKDALGLASLSYKQGIALRTNLPGAKLAELADNFSSVASEVETNVIMTVAKMNTTLRDKNRLTAGQDIARYGELFIAPVAAKMTALRLGSMSQHKQALDEIVYGLRKAAQ